FMKTMYYITDLINDTNNRFFITYNPSILNNQQQALLKQVVTELPHNHSNSMVLTEELHTVLEFIQQQKNKGSLVTLKKIKQQLELSYPTIKKRLSELEQKGLILRRKQGRSKTVHISQKGEQILKK
ncbi:MAG: BlaI/MecI/CopY family transcriptional regulator, partial [Thermoplasmatota archaeon]